MLLQIKVRQNIKNREKEARKVGDNVKQQAKSTQKKEK